MRLEVLLWPFLEDRSIMKSKPDGPVNKPLSKSRFQKMHGKHCTEKPAFLSLLGSLLSCSRLSLWSQPKYLVCEDLDTFYTNSCLCHPVPVHTRSSCPLCWPRADRTRAQAGSLIQPHLSASLTTWEPGVQRSVLKRGHVGFSKEEKKL